MPRVVLDASAVLAVILEESGAEVVVEALRSGAAMSAVNVAEVASRLHQDGWTESEVASVFVYSLVPIALAYNIAHFFSLLAIQGQLIIPLASNPFGYGWDLFGTADYLVNIALVNARFTWALSVVAIVLGHIIAVYLSHVIALRAFSDSRSAVRSQYPMMALMVMYTVVSLWIVAQPIVRHG